MQNDISNKLAEQVKQAFADKTVLRIAGGESKAFYGHPIEGERLSVAEHRGVLNYEPTELVLTARAGTPLADIEQVLADNGQMLAFEPPAFGSKATLGGTIACNLSGPRRPWAGAARDFVLGCKITNGQGEVLSFGGEVMKNVAGYDAARLMAGALGSLGVLLEISLKVLPLPETEITLAFELDVDAALDKLQQLSRGHLPLTGGAYYQGRLLLRFAGAERAVAAARDELGGDEPGINNLAEGASFWQQLREQQLDFFKAEGGDLWRLSLPADAPAMQGIVEAVSEADCYYDWGGALRWLRLQADASNTELVVSLRQQAAAAGGHATLFRPADANNPVARFQPLPEALLAVQRRLKLAFDPASILNPGRLYPSL